MPDDMLLALRDDRKMTLHEIAEVNHAATGFRPDRAQLSRKLAALGAESTTYRSPLLAALGEIRPEHNGSRWRRMLNAKGKQLAGLDLKEAEKRAVRLLEFLLNPGRGKRFVVTYHPAVGFCLVDAREGEQIIRPSVLPDSSDQDMPRLRLA